MTRDYHLKSNDLGFKSSSYGSQQGATLIVVLLMLVLIMMLGVIAVRQSVRNLKTATADQIDTLMLQSNDNVLFSLENAVNAPVTSNQHLAITGLAGVFGHFMSSTGAASNDKVNLCYRPNQRIYTIHTAAVSRNGGILSGSNSDGYCNPTQAEDYGSGRQVAMTQASITQVPVQANEEGFSRLTYGNQAGGNISENYEFMISSTSILPAYTEVDTDDIHNCFKENDVVSCMKNKSVPVRQLIEQVAIKNEQQEIMCTGYGGGGVTSTNPLCSDI